MSMPQGGAPAKHLGYRAGIGALQDAAAAARQQAGSDAPPDAANVRHLSLLLDLLAARGVAVAVVFPPLLGRDVLYVAPPSRATVPYRAIADDLRRRGIPMLVLDEAAQRVPAEFVNAGHLNDRGAQRYTALLAQALNRTSAPAAKAVDASAVRP